MLFVQAEAFYHLVSPSPLPEFQDDEEGDEDDDDEGSEMELDEDYPDINAAPHIRFERFDRDDDLIIEFDNMFSTTGDPVVPYGLWFLKFLESLFIAPTVIELIGVSVLSVGNSFW